MRLHENYMSLHRGGFADGQDPGSTTAAAFVQLYPLISDSESRRAPGPDPGRTRAAAGTASYSLATY